MQPETAENLTRGIRDFLAGEQTKLQASLRQGAPPREYEVLEVTSQALVIALEALDRFIRERDEYCAAEVIQQCLALIQERQENTWKGLPGDERLHRTMAGVGFLAADMGLLAEAQALFDLLARLSPDNVHHLLGLVYAKLIAGAWLEVLDLLRNKVLHMEPGNDLGLAFLALACVGLNKKEEALAAAAAVLTADRDENAVNLAREIQRGLNQP